MNILQLVHLYYYNIYITTITIYSAFYTTVEPLLREGTPTVLILNTNKTLGTKIRCPDKRSVHSKTNNIIDYEYNTFKQ